MIMRVLIDLTNIIGFASASFFLAMFRPSRLFSPTMINAIGMTFALWLVYASILMLTIGGGSFAQPTSHDVEQVVYLILRCAADTVLVARLVLFLRFRDDYRNMRVTIDDRRTGP